MKNWICLAFQYGFPKTLILLCAIKHDVCVKRITTIPGARTHFLVLRSVYR